MRKVWGCTEMSAALFDLDNDGTLEILISRANIKKITRVTVAEPGRKTAKSSFQMYRRWNQNGS